MSAAQADKLADEARQAEQAVRDARLSKKEAEGNVKRLRSREKQLQVRTRCTLWVVSFSGFAHCIRRVDTDVSFSISRDGAGKYCILSTRFEECVALLFSRCYNG